MHGETVTFKSSRDNQKALHVWKKGAKMCFCQKCFRTYGHRVLSVVLCILVITMHRNNK